MSELEKSKKNILTQLQGLCAHCSARRSHRCPIQRIASEVKAISGIPLLVNNEFRGVVWQ
jgi:hypothetical protein